MDIRFDFRRETGKRSQSYHTCLQKNTHITTCSISIFFFLWRLNWIEMGCDGGFFLFLFGLGDIGLSSLKESSAMMSIQKKKSIFGKAIVKHIVQQTDQVVFQLKSLAIFLTINQQSMASEQWPAILYDSMVSPTSSSGDTTTSVQYKIPSADIDACSCMLAIDFDSFKFDSGSRCPTLTSMFDNHDWRCS